MIILLGSKNPSKKLALELALDELKISNYEIISYDACSNVSSKPINNDILLGVINRNEDLKKYAIDNKIAYDYLCSLEGGYLLDDSNLAFVVTYCVIEDQAGKKSTGKSLGLRITKNMFDYIQKGFSLNEVIEEITKTDNNKQNGGITSYLSNGLLNRKNIDKDAVISSFVSHIFADKKILLDKKVEEKLK